MVTEDDVVEWLYQRVVASGVTGPHLGRLEQAVEQLTREVRRQVLERLTQEAAARAAVDCPRGGRLLPVVAHRRGRVVESSFGPLRFGRSYGRCPHCQT